MSTVCVCECVPSYFINVRAWLCVPTPQEKDSKLGMDGYSIKPFVRNVCRVGQGTQYCNPSMPKKVAGLLSDWLMKIVYRRARPTD